MKTAACILVSILVFATFANSEDSPRKAAVLDFDVRGWLGDEQPERSQDLQSSPGMTRRMNSSKRGTVNAVSPWFGLQITPLEINWLRVGPSEVTFRLNSSAMSPDRWGPGLVIGSTA